MTIRPYQYPLLVGAISLGILAARTIVRTASKTIPANSKFVWTHTLNSTLKASVGIESVKVMMYDSVHGPLFNVPTLVQNIAGATFETFAAAPRAIRPFPLPEAYTFNAGAVLTATYTIFMEAVNGGNASFAEVGIILCGFRVINNEK